MNQNPIVSKGLSRTLNIRDACGVLVSIRLFMEKASDSVVNMIICRKDRRVEIAGIFLYDLMMAWQLLARTRHSTSVIVRIKDDEPLHFKRDIGHPDNPDDYDAIEFLLPFDHRLHTMPGSNTLKFWWLGIISSAATI